MRVSVGVAALAALLFVPTGRVPGSSPCSVGGASRYTSGGALRVDVDGDRVGDQVWIARAPRRPPSCRWLLVARTRSRLHVAALRQNGLERSYWAQSNGRFPKLAIGTDVDRRPGVELFVRVDGGAHADGYGVFARRRAGLVRLQGPGSEFGDAFYEGAGGTVFSAFGCAAPGIMVQGDAGSEQARYSGTRRFYGVEDRRFRLVRTSRFRGLSYDELRRLPEFSARRFGRC